jgi:hypothetical protein
LGPDDRRNQLIFNHFSASAPLKTREKLLKTRAPVDSFRAGGSTKRRLKTAPPRGGGHKRTPPLRGGAAPPPVLAPSALAKSTPPWEGFALPPPYGRLPPPLVSNKEGPRGGDLMAKNRILDNGGYHESRGDTRGFGGSPARPKISQNSRIA